MKKIFYAILIKKALLLCLVASMLGYQQQSYAQALPVANFVMNRAVAGVITKVALTRGFAANDARIAATMAGAGTAMTAVNVVSAVAGVGLTVAGAPVWLTIAGGLAVLAVGAAIVAGTTTISVQPTGTGNKLQVNSASSVLAPPYPAPMSPPSDFAYLVNNGQEIYRDPACYASQLCYAFPALPMGDIPVQWKPVMGIDAGPVVVVFWSLDSFKTKWTPNKVPPGVLFDGHWYSPVNLSSTSWTSGPSWDLSQMNKRLIGNLRTVFLNNAVYPDGTPAAPVDPINSAFASDAGAPLTLSANFGPQIYSDLNVAASALSPSVKAEKISSSTLAQIVDKAWQAAAMQPAYQGLPYSYMQPVTAMDVDPWMMANPASVPTVADLLVPASNPGTSTVPISPTVTPGTTTPPVTDPTSPPATSSNVNVVNTPNVNVTNQVQVDLGPNPNTASPLLEASPTAQAILQPLLDLFPSLRTFIVPSHSSECPKPSFSIFGKTIVMDSHCTVLDGVKPILSAVMAFVWVGVALFIVLAA